MLLYRYIRISVELLTRRGSASLPSLHDRSTQTSGCTHTLYESLYICLLIDNLLYTHWMFCRASSWQGQTPCSTSTKVALFLTQNTPTTYMYKYIILVLSMDEIFSSYISFLSVVTMSMMASGKSGSTICKSSMA